MASWAKQIQVLASVPAHFLLSDMLRRLVWSLFAAAYSDDPVVQQNIVDQIWGRVSSNATDTGIFSTVYKLGGNGAPIGNMAR